MHHVARQGPRRQVGTWSQHLGGLTSTQEQLGPVRKPPATKTSDCRHCQDAFGAEGVDLIPSTTNLFVERLVKAIFQRVRLVIDRFVILLLICNRACMLACEGFCRDQQQRPKTQSRPVFTLRCATTDTSIASYFSQSSYLNECPACL